MVASGGWRRLDHVIGPPVTSVQRSIIRRQRVVVRAEHPQILRPVVAPVAIDMVDVQWNLPRDWVSFGPAAHHARAELVEKVMANVS